MQNFSNLMKVADLKLGQLIGTELHFAQAPETFEQSLSIILSFARADHPDYPSSLDQSVRELYTKTATRKKISKVAEKPTPKKNGKKRISGKEKTDGLTVS